MAERPKASSARSSPDGNQIDKPMSESDTPNRIGTFFAIVLDVSDLDRSVEFWLQVFGGEKIFADDAYARVGDLSRPPTLLLQKVPEVKTVKNRVHLDFEIDDLDAAIERVVKLGGHEVNRVSEYGITFAVMADLDGNEFCLIDPPDAGS